MYKTKVYIFAVLISLYMCYILACMQNYSFWWWGKGDDIQRQRWEYAEPRADHDRAGPEYRYLDRYATANTDYVDYGTKDIQVLHNGI